VRDVADNWVECIDNQPKDEARSAAIRDALRAYELITVPVQLRGEVQFRAPTRPVHLLRRRSLDLAPRLSVELDGRHFRVSVRHRSHQQIVDLRVGLIDSGGHAWSVLPTGGVREGSTGMMRTSVLLFDTGGGRAIDLASGDIPPGLDIVEMLPVLRNPLARAEHLFALVSPPLPVPIGH
jgi:hypothetical protein